MLLIIFVKSDKWRIWPISPNTNSKKKMSIEVANGFTILSGHMDSSFKEKDPSFLNSSCTQRPLLLDFGISSYFSFRILKSVSVFFLFLLFRDAFFFLFSFFLFFFFFFFAWELRLWMMQMGPLSRLSMPITTMVINHGSVL